MRKVCFHFQITQPYRLRTYRFFDIDKNHNYFDDFQNSYLANRLAERFTSRNTNVYRSLKNNDIFSDFSITGDSNRLFKIIPAVMKILKKMVATGKVEKLETFLS